MRSRSTTILQSSISSGEQGTVSIDFIINVDGIVSECGVAQTSGKTRLDQAACQLVIRRWRYKPAMQDGKPVRVRTTANIAFQLTGIPQREALAHAAVNRGDYATAITIWRPLAEQGDPTARTVLGVLYANGEGVAQDYAEAARWYQLAASQGYKFAQFSLGLLYESGRGVPENPVKAAMWFTLASSRADMASMRASTMSD